MRRHFAAHDTLSTIVSLSDRVVDALQSAYTRSNNADGWVERYKKATYLLERAKINVQSALSTKSGASFRTASSKGVGFAYTTELSPESIKRTLDESTSIANSAWTRNLPVPCNSLSSLTKLPLYGASLNAYDPDSVENILTSMSIWRHRAVQAVSIARISRIHALCDADTAILDASDLVVATIHLRYSFSKVASFSFGISGDQLDTLNDVTNERLRQLIPPSNAHNQNPKIRSIILDPLVVGEVARSVYVIALQQSDDTQIADTALALSDSPNHPRVQTRIDIDHLGFVTEPTPLISNKILHSIDHSNLAYVRSSYRAQPTQSPSTVVLDGLPHVQPKGAAIYITSWLTTEIQQDPRSEFGGRIQGVLLRDGQPVDIISAGFLRISLLGLLQLAIGVYGSAWNVASSTTQAFAPGLVVSTSELEGKGGRLEIIY